MKNVIDFEINEDAVKTIEIEKVREVIRSISEEKILEMNSFYKKCYDTYSKSFVMEKIMSVMDIIYEFSHCNIEQIDGVPYFANTKMVFPFDDMDSKLTNAADASDVIYYRGHSLDMFREEFAEYVKKISIISDSFAIIKDNEGEESYQFFQLNLSDEL